ncbi:MAG TPA: hypothetical protein VD791_11445 [Burkholderiales bacterium]|nr:hypothetical protein [Burkholderiales bacterium]
MDLSGYGYRRAQRTTSSTTNDTGSSTFNDTGRVTSNNTASATAATTASGSTSELSAEAVRLLASLGKRVSMNELAAQYPRVLNRIAAVWYKRAEADRCFDELLLDARRTRQGFPQSVVYEIASLRHHHVTHVFPKHVDPWEQSQLR